MWIVSPTGDVTGMYGATTGATATTVVTGEAVPVVVRDGLRRRPG